VSGVGKRDATALGKRLADMAHLLPLLTTLLTFASDGSSPQDTQSLVLGLALLEESL
jgi:hypothetical protein